MSFFSIQNIAFSALGYQMSWLELVGSLFGLWAVWLSTKAIAINWAIGILSIICLFILFYQIQLYSDMFLQVFFFITNLYGWYSWTHPRTQEEANAKQELKITSLTNQSRIAVVLISVTGTALFGFCISQIHLWLPSFFKLPAAYPYADTFIAVVSIIGQLIMTRKKIECWLLWGIVDAIATYLYFKKGVLLMSIEYFIFLLICVAGLYRWNKEMRQLPASSP